MASKKSANEATETTKIIEPKSEQKSNAELENEQLKKQLAEMQVMMAQLMENQKKPESKKDDEDIFHSIEDELNISPHKLVRVVSMTIGGLSLKGANGREPIQFRDFSASKTVTFEDVRAFVDNHHELAIGGGFIIQDKDVVKALYLEEEYSKLLSAKKVENLIDLSGKEIVNILESVPKTLQNTIVEYFIRQMPKDNRYTDYNKIKLISDFVGEDLNELAKGIHE